ncbi:hypothetical protein Malapachy_4248 [Malassezia pachydermatis]|uniref:Uncharacterized protein n=1 Tax=Malassezia pachydermatis TaxID=77020 RepID=A0A0M8MVB1_9BASI|nr:hypothetical protein Malapachy_4248 [Malassezia pachydermatis]KOS14311.1 hypothetical protein Malapachy_4248 [Malassezia pachydermatis]
MMMWSLRSASSRLARPMLHQRVCVPVRTFQQSAVPRTKTNAVAQYVGPFRMAYYRIKLFSLSSLAVASIFAPVFVLWPHKMEMAARLGIAATTLGASSVSTGLISWIGSPYVGHMTLRKAEPDAAPLHYMTESANERLLDDTPSDPSRHASEKYYLEIATLSWHMRSLKTTVYAPSLLRPTTRALATWELPEMPNPLTIEHPKLVGEHTVSSLVAETVDVSSGKVIGRWWARWRVSPTESDEPMAFEGVCESEGKPVRYFYVDEAQLGDEWRVLE